MTPHWFYLKVNVFAGVTLQGQCLDRHPQEMTGNVRSRSPAQTCWSRNSGGEVQQCVFSQTLQKILMGAIV